MPEVPAGKIFPNVAANHKTEPDLVKTTLLGMAGWG
jgi:hypothetical protein